MDFIGARVAVFRCSLPRRHGDTEKEAGPDIFCCSCRKMAFVSEAFRKTVEASALRVQKQEGSFAAPFRRALLRMRGYNL